MEVRQAGVQECEAKLRWSGEGKVSVQVAWGHPGGLDPLAGVQLPFTLLVFKHLFRFC